CAWTDHRRPERGRLKVRYVNDIPDMIPPGTLYIVGENGFLWSISMACPCGCGDTIQASLHKEGRPRWRLLHNANETVSIQPSIWRTTGCRSHFFVRQSRVEWVRSSSVGDSPFRVN